MKGIFMKKFLTLALVALFAGSAVRAEGLAEETTPASETLSVKAKIVSLINREIKKPGTPLNQAVEALKKENDIPESGSLNEVSESDIFLLSNGRAGGGIYGQIYLVGLPVSWKGTGLIEEYLAYLHVSASLYLEVRDTVRVEKFVEITDKK
jgi:hypothetical protein